MHNWEEDTGMYQRPKKDPTRGELIAEVIGYYTLCVLGFVGIIAGLIAVFAVPNYYSDRAECRYAQQNSGNETKFIKNHILSWDCYVKVDGKWIPIDKWRGVEGDN